MSKLVVCFLAVAMLIPVTEERAQAAPTAYTDEASYLSALAAASYQTRQEGFENDAAWGVARRPNAADSVTSQGIVWTSNHPDAMASSRITTGSGPALSGSWGAYSSPHGDPDRELSAATCDVTPPPDPCLQHDGLLGTSTSGTLYGAGGWISGTFGGQVVLVLGGNPEPIDFGDEGVISGGGHQFFGVIEPAGFPSFEVREIEGKSGDEKLIFADDFTIAGVFTPQPNISVSTTSLVFGSVTVDSSADLMLTVTNTGNADLSVFTLASANPLGDPFSLIADQDNCSNQTLTPSTSCTVAVRFAPQSTGPDNDSFDIPSDDPDTPTVTISVTGTGDPMPQPKLSVSSASLAFGTVTLGASADETLTLTNTGNADLMVSGVGSANPLAAPFQLVPGEDRCSDQVLMRLTSCTVMVRYAPTSTGPDNDSFDIPSDDPDTPTVTISVSGTGTAMPTPRLSLSSTALAFGTMTLDSSANQTLTLTNTGNADLSVSMLGWSNPLLAPFQLVAGDDRCSEQVLAPATSCTVIVRYAPTEEGVHNDSFDIPSDDPDSPSVTVSVNGTGTSMSIPSLSVSSTSLVFGSVTVENSAEQTLTLSNAGDADLLVFELGLVNPLLGPFEVVAAQDGCSDQMLSPETSCTVVVRYAPTDDGIRNDSFDIPSNDPDTPSVTVSVTGTGLSAAANNPPTAPALISPPDGMVDLPTTVTFVWHESTDPDGDDVTYDLHYCENSDFEGCPPVESIAFLGAPAPHRYAGLGGIGLLAFVFVFGAKRRRGNSLLIAMLLSSCLMLLSSCRGAANDDGDNFPEDAVQVTVDDLSHNTTYYWKVVASDGTDSPQSVVRKFTTR